MSRRQARHVTFDAQKVQVRRRELGLTNEQLAEVVGVTLRTVQRWQLGEGAPAGIQGIRLAQALGVEAADLYLEGTPA